MKHIFERLNKRYLIIGCAVLLLVGGLALVVNAKAGAAKETYWAVKAGDETVLLMSTEEGANKVIKGVETKYLTKGSKVQKVSVTPALSVKKGKYEKANASSDIPLFSKAKKGVNYLVSGVKAKKYYKVKKGDTVWGIATKMNLKIKEIKKMNPKLNLDKIHPGDKIKLYQVKPFVKVKTTEKITKKVKIKNKVKYKKSSKILEGHTKVKVKGHPGYKKVTGIYKKVNGKLKSKKILSSEVIKKPKTRVVYKGTKPNPSYRGQKVANYACKFVGNPYKYGGTSLTHGCDCSGFVMSVYAHFGVTLPHGARSMEGYGKHVSLKNARPGDIVIYTHHVAIYIGNGNVVHSRDEAQGICITSVYASVYPGQSIVDVRRIFY